MENAKKSCEYIRDGVLFADCYGLVDFDYFYDMCKFEMSLSSSDTFSMCATLESYSRECAQHGKIINWRQNNTLAKICG